MSRSKPGSLVYARPDGREETFLLKADVTTIGRSDTCAVVIPLPIVSRLHATIELQHGRYLLADVGSANGTFVNGARIEHPQPLSTNDQIWVGSEEVALQFYDPEETLVVTRLQVADPLRIDEQAREVYVYDVVCDLSPLEYDLLLYLARNPGTVCTRDACFLAVWGRPYDHAICEDALNACVTKLRRNLRAAAASVQQEPPQLTTIPRVGFRLDADVTFNKERASTL